MPEKRRYAVTQTTFVWAESRAQAARIARRNQLRPKVGREYSDFRVCDMEERPDGAFTYDPGWAYGICIFDKDV